MSHFAVAVFLPDEKHSVDRLLEPKPEVNKYDNDGEVTVYEPDYKWDSYRIGGRYQGELMLKPQKKGIRSTQSCKEMPEGYDGAFVQDIDFEAMRKRDLAKLQPYEEAMKDSYMSEEEMRTRFPTEKEYIERETLFATYAVITPDGEWHTEEDWNMDTETPEEERTWQLNYHERFIRPALKNNWYMVIVDCHI